MNILKFVVCESEMLILHLLQQGQRYLLSFRVHLAQECKVCVSSVLVFGDRIGELLVHLVVLAPLNYIIGDNMHPFCVAIVLDVVVVGLVDE
jgi:hypothetical protein